MLLSTLYSLAHNRFPWHRPVRADVSERRTHSCCIASPSGEEAGIMSSGSKGPLSRKERLERRIQKDLVKQEEQLLAKFLDLSVSSVTCDEEKVFFLSCPTVTPKPREAICIYCLSTLRG